MGANNRIKVSELQFFARCSHASARTDASAGSHPRRSKRALRVDDCSHHMSSPATSGPRRRSSIHPSADCTLRRRSSDPAGNSNEASVVRALNANPLVVSVRSPHVAAFRETLPRTSAPNLPQSAHEATSDPAERRPAAEWPGVASIPDRPAARRLRPTRDFRVQSPHPIARQHGAWMARRPPREPENRRVRLNSRNRHAHRAPPILDVTKREARITQPLRAANFKPREAAPGCNAAPNHQGKAAAAPSRATRDSAKKSGDDGA